MSSLSFAGLSRVFARTFRSGESRVRRPCWINNDSTSVVFCCSSTWIGFPVMSHGKMRSMSRANQNLPPSTDPLGETPHLLRLTGTVYCRTELTAPWGVDLPPLGGCMMFHVVTAGKRSPRSISRMDVGQSRQRALPRKHRLQSNSKQHNCSRI